jgi:hypothetical protein
MLGGSPAAILNVPEVEENILLAELVSDKAKPLFFHPGMDSSALSHHVVLPIRSCLTSAPAPAWRASDAQARIRAAVPRAPPG